jgi:hypothetical protein
VFDTNDVLASYMRAFEDVLYAHRSSMPAARIMHFRDQARATRRRQASVSNVDGVLAGPEDEMVCDFGVYSSVRQMRVALHRSAPYTNNPLQLWQPASVVVREDVAAQTPIDVSASTPPTSITAGDALRLTAICPPDTGRIKRAPLPVTAEWTHGVDALAVQIAASSSRAAWSQLIELTWHTYVDAGQPRMNRVDLPARLDALMASTQPSAGDPTRRTVVRWRFVWWCALAMRWRCPSGHIGVDTLDADTLVTDITARFTTLAETASGAGVPHVLHEALAVLRFVASGHNVALYGRLNLDSYALCDQAVAIIAQTHNGTLAPADIWQVVTAVFPLEVAGIALRDSNPTALVDLGTFNRAVDALDLLAAQPEQIISTLVGALVRGPIWRAPAAYISQQLTASGMRGCTRFRRTTATASADSEELGGSLQDLAVQSIDALLQLPSVQAPFYVRQGTLSQPDWLPHRM